jgi:hypothetical protein
MKENEIDISTLISDWEIAHPQEIYKLQLDNVYTYRLLDSLWKLLEQGTMPATNVRFSNDEMEHLLGRNLLFSGDSKNPLELSDFFMICFTIADGNKLSQWRGYTDKGLGVSIKMDFSRSEVFRAVKKDSDKCLNLFSRPTKVYYGKSDSNDLTIFEGEASETVQSIIDKTPENEYFADSNTLKNDLLPYVKHSSFFEEAEARLIFNLPPSVNADEYVHYRDAPAGNHRIPYLLLRYGDAIPSKEAEGDGFCKKVTAGSSVDSEVIERIKSMLESYDKNESCHTEFCYLENLKKNEIYLSGGTNQPKLFIEIEKEVRYFCIQKNIADDKRPRVYCDGYWPIREIKVGPCKDREIIEESIKYYCMKHYWLNNVDVNSSDIPYRG